MDVGGMYIGAKRSKLAIPRSPEMVVRVYSGMKSDRFVPDEFQDDLRHNKPGIVSMVNSGKNRNTSQFLITLREIDYFDNQYTIIGQVAEGLDVVSKIGDSFAFGEEQLEDIRILHTYVLFDPTDDPEGLERIIPSKSPSPNREIVEKGKMVTQKELEERINADVEAEAKRKALLEKKDMRSRAEVLTMLGDIPYSEIKPDEDVLFVCQLNPVTRSEDLALIFSQFGQCKAEVILDRETGDSLQYAFIEFELKESCIEAYFKMNNVLIDDRRILVDFSQSVANKYKNQKPSLMKRISNLLPKETNGSEEFIFNDEKILKHHKRGVEDRRHRSRDKSSYEHRHSHRNRHRHHSDSRSGKESNHRKHEHRSTEKSAHKRQHRRQ